MDGVAPLLNWVGGTWALARRELLSLFVTPLAYFVTTLFLLNQGWNFALLLRVLNDPLAAPGPVMQYYFGGSFFIFWLPVTFICAAISMRLIAEERRQGTLEALLTTPLSASQVVVGKFVGAYAFFVSIWLPTGVFYVLLASATLASPDMRPEVGPILAGYLGTGLVGSAFLAVGLLSSAISRSQLGAAIATFVSCTIALMAGLLVDQVDSAAVSAILERTSLLVSMQELAQGIVDGRWLWMYGTTTVVLLGWATVAVNPRRDAQSWLQAGLFAVAIINVGVYGARHSERRDWTEGRVYTLSPRAIDVLSKLEARVDVTVIVPANLGAGRANPLQGELREVLRRMGDVAPSLDWRILDPDRSREEAERLLDDFGLGGRELADGVVLIRAGQGTSLRRAHLLPHDLVAYATGPDVQVNGPRVKAFLGEESLLTKFIEVTSERKVRVCHTVGHGEPEMDDLEPFNGYAHLRDLLVGANLDVAPVELDRAGALSGCDLLMIAGPSGALRPGEVDAVRAYLDEGGDLLLMAGAVILRNRPALARHGLEDLLAALGIRFGDRVTLDPNAKAGDSRLLAFTLSSGWADHPVTRSLLMRPVSFVLARELSVEAPAVTLMASSDEGWAEGDVAGFQVGAAPSFDTSSGAAADRRGPVPLAAAAERGDTRVVVIASDRFAINANLREDVAYDHGRDLILNAVAWTTQREMLLGIRAREREHVKLVLTESQLERMILVCLVGLPGFSALLGLFVLWRRRR